MSTIIASILDKKIMAFVLLLLDLVQIKYPFFVTVCFQIFIVLEVFTCSEIYGVITFHEMNFRVNHCWKFILHVIMTWYGFRIWRIWIRITCYLHNQNFRIQKVYCCQRLYVIYDWVFLVGTGSSPRIDVWNDEKYKNCMYI